MVLIYNSSAGELVLKRGDIVIATEAIANFPYYKLWVGVKVKMEDDCSGVVIQTSPHGGGPKMGEKINPNKSGGYWELFHGDVGNVDIWE